MSQDGGQKPLDIERSFKHPRREIEGKRAKTLKKKSLNPLDHQEIEFFYSLLRHELGNGLQILLANIEAIEMLMGGMPVEANRLLTSMSAATEQMVSLLKSLETKSDFNEGNIVEMLQTAANVAQNVHSGMRVNVNVSDAVKALSLPCYRLLGIVYENLFRNAVEHCGEEVIVDISVTRDLNIIVIDVTDNGPGVPNELRQRIFHRGVSSNGGGLGLYMVKRLLNYYYGQIELLPSPHGHGARFLITLPVST